jgi:hypothetical protein
MHVCPVDFESTGIEYLRVYFGSTLDTLPCIACAAISILAGRQTMEAGFVYLVKGIYMHVHRGAKHPRNGRNGSLRSLEFHHTTCGFRTTIKESKEHRRQLEKQARPWSSLFGHGIARSGLWVNLNGWY